MNLVEITSSIHRKDLQHGNDTTTANCQQQGEVDFSTDDGRDFLFPMVSLLAEIIINS